jgi:beta-phosphoglucomutase-like phosphatase (HAD superfamily)
MARSVLSRCWMGSDLSAVSAAPRRLSPASSRPDPTASFAVTISTEDVGADKPSPDAHLEVALRLDVRPLRFAAVEGSTTGRRAARVAGTRVVTLPTRSVPPDPTELDRAAAVSGSIDELTDRVVDPTGARQ